MVHSYSIFEVVLNNFLAEIFFFITISSKKKKIKPSTQDWSKKGCKLFFKAFKIQAD